MKVTTAGLHSTKQGRLGAFVGFVIKNGVFQNDPGPPEYALELRDYVKYMFFSLHFSLHYSQELNVQKVNLGV